MRNDTAGDFLLLSLEIPHFFYEQNVKDIELLGTSYLIKFTSFFSDHVQY